MFCALFKKTKPKQNQTTKQKPNNNQSIKENQPHTHTKPQQQNSVSQAGIPIEVLICIHWVRGD